MNPYNVAALLGRRAGLSEAQEQVLRGMLSGLPDEALRRFENFRRGQGTLEATRAEILRRLGWRGRLWLRLVQRLELRRRNRQLEVHYRETRRHDLQRAAEQARSAHLRQP